jgi:alkyldihydroxyacetonephosphate synthase
VFGVITSGTARIRSLPETVGYWGCLLPDWPEAIVLARSLLQAGVRPAVVRLSNEEETRWLMKTSAEKKGLVQRLGKAYIQWAMRRRGFDPERVCLCILSFEGSTDVVRLAQRRARAVAAECRAIGLGSAPGRSWQRERFSLPYFRDGLMARGVMVDTLETATTWDNVERLDRAVRDAILSGIEAGGTRGAVMVHVSHVYETGAALYFTFLARHQTGNELGQWQTIKTSATKAIIENGGTLSHHHGIGYEHQPLEAEHGPVAVEALRAFKASVDPADVMNPEKLL